MRRRIALLCAAAALLAPGAAPAGTVEPGAVADEGAIASWMFPTERPRHSRWFFAGAYRNATVGGKTVTVGFGVKGACKRARGVTTCHGRGIGGDLPHGAFEVDPALQGARLVLRDGPRRHELTWDGEGDAPPSGYIASEGCDEGAGFGGGFMQHATAAGTLFGRRLGHGGVDHAILSRGAMLTECTDVSIATLARRAAAGETITLVFR